MQIKKWCNLARGFTAKRCKKGRTQVLCVKTTFWNTRNSFPSGRHVSGYLTDCLQLITNSPIAAFPFRYTSSTKGLSAQINIPQEGPVLYAARTTRNLLLVNMIPLSKPTRTVNVDSRSSSRVQWHKLFETRALGYAITQMLFLGKFSNEEDGK